MRSIKLVLAFLIIFLVGTTIHSQETMPPDYGEPLQLTLEECIEMGLERNPELQIEKSQVDQAKSKTMQIKSNKVPSLDLSANYVISNTLPDLKLTDPQYFASSSGFADPNGNIVPGLPGHIHLVGFPGFEFVNDRTGEVMGVKVESTYPLYTGGKLKNGIKASETMEKVEAEQVRQKRNELIYNIKKMYFTILFTRKTIEVVDDAYNTTEGFYDQVKALYNEGMASSLDVLTVESKLAESRPRQIEARNGNKLARLGLNNLLNVDLTYPVEPVGELVYERKELPVSADLYAIAVKNRPEMRALQYQREALLLSLKIAKANGYPTVGLFANYQWNRGQETPPNDTLWRDGYQAGAAMSMPLYDGRETEGMVAETEAMLFQLDAGRRALDLGIRTQIEQAVTQIRSSEENIEMHKANVTAAEKNHQAAKTRYAVGLATNLDVMAAQTQLLAANLGYYNEVYNYNVAWASLMTALAMPEERDIKP
jgi:outer membrane protein